ncbi:MAG: mycothiol system anti-sigma-R factor [Actinomycetota bacterium]|nr:mycothiol system anti-sigma-R factor [Actinomycetota bacterium]
MPDCTETIHELYEYLDGELTEDKRRHIEQHLNDCSPCYEAFDFEAELRMVIRRRCTEAVPDQLRQRIARALEVPE